MAAENAGIVLVVLGIPNAACATVVAVPAVPWPKPKGATDAAGVAKDRAVEMAGVPKGDADDTGVAPKVKPEFVVLTFGATWKDEGTVDWAAVAAPNGEAVVVAACPNMNPIGAADAVEAGAAPKVDGVVVVAAGAPKPVKDEVACGVVPKENPADGVVAAGVPKLNPLKPAVVVVVAVAAGAADAPLKEK